MSLFTSLSFRGNIYVELVKKILLSLVLFQLCRLGFYVFNFNYFSGISLKQFGIIVLGGLKFDLAAALYLNALVILLVILPHPWRFHKFHQQLVKYTFFFFNALAMAMNVVDFVYYKFTLRRTTSDVFAQFENETNKLGFAFQFLLDYWYAFFVWILLVWLMVWLYRFITVKGPMIKNPYLHYGGSLIMMGLIAGLFVAGVRGGFRHSARPITLSNAGEFVSRPEHVSLVLNTPFSIIRTWGKTKIKKATYFSSEEKLNAIYSPVHYPKDSIAFRNKNVVVIILESFSKEFFGVFNKDKEEGRYRGYTPFLDSLVQHSLTYEYSYANGLKSIDGLPSVVSSIPSLGIPYVLTPFSSNTINSLGSLLKEKGYHSSFFHGAPNGSMGFNSFMKLAGFEHYYGMDEYNNNNDFDGLWGIWDEKFFQFFSKELNGFPQPFVSTIFSVSSHHPFKIPTEYETRFKGGPQPINKCIEYTDFALKQFFKSASTMPWYENTLFVITADHISSNIQFEEDRTLMGIYSVPIIFFSPQKDMFGMKSEIIQQIDIMPTVLGYLHYDAPYVSFGRDALNEGSEPFTFTYLEGTYRLCIGDYLLLFDGNRTVALYNFKQDKSISNNILEQHLEKASEMEKKIKAIIQQYNNRMIENRMVVK